MNIVPEEAYDLSCYRGPEQIVRGDQQGQRPGKTQFKSGSATTSGRAFLANLMTEGLGDQVLLLRLYQVLSAVIWCTSTHPSRNCIILDCLSYGKTIHSAVNSLN